MLISEINIPLEDVLGHGLQGINMQRLSRYVVLTGKNGSGKSRLLNAIETHIYLRNDSFPNVEQYKRQIIDHQNVISSNPESPHIKQWMNSIAAWETSVKNATQRIFLNNSNESIVPVRFVPKTLELADSRNLNYASLQAFYEQAKNPGVDSSKNTCLAYIQNLQDLHREATHPESLEKHGENSEITQSYITLKDLILSLLKTELSRSGRDATIFNKPLADANLSDGQKILLQLVVAIHAQSGVLKNVILVMDEPENHLHPSALVECLETLSAAAPNAQFFIATHSVPLLAHLAAKDPMAIWYVEDGKITNAGRYPERVLNGLLGEGERLAELQAFTALPAQYAAINYAIESLYTPKSMGPTTNDPQISQINQLLTASGKAYSLLDYGAGQGRLLSGLNEIAIENDKLISEVVEYYAYEPYQPSFNLCVKLTEKIYKSDQNRVYKNRDEYFSTNNKEKIDIVVMCNVLHEINPHEWLGIFSSNSFLVNALRDEGYLLIVEDQRIPFGEKAHQFGFIVLDTAHLKTLFSVTENDIKNKDFVVNDYRQDGRLKAHLVRKKLLSRMTSETRRIAILELQATAKERIMSLRTETPTYLNGQLNGFWTQQFANTSLFLET